MAAAATAGGRQSHWVGWLEKKTYYVLGVSAVVGRFQVILTFVSIFRTFLERFGYFQMVLHDFRIVLSFLCCCCHDRRFFHRRCHRRSSTSPACNGAFHN